MAIEFNWWGQGIIVKLFSSDAREAFVRVGDTFPHRATPPERLLVTSRATNALCFYCLQAFDVSYAMAFGLKSISLPNPALELNETARLIARHRFESSRFHNMTPPVK